MADVSWGRASAERNLVREAPIYYTKRNVCQPLTQAFLSTVE